MTLEQWAYIGEIVAAVAVVASLIYVTRQLGQHTAMVRVNASNERLQRDYDLSTTIGNREFMEIWLKGAIEFNRLDEPDRMRLLFFQRRAIMHWHNMFRARRQKLLSDTDWYELKWVLPKFVQREDLKEAWKMFKDGFDEAFQEFMEERIALGDQPKQSN